MNNNWMSVEDMLKLPKRPWDQKSVYDSIYIVPTDMIHDSGYRLMAIVGAKNRKPVEIAAYCDDLAWTYDRDMLKSLVQVLEGSDFPVPMLLRCDMDPVSNVTRVWAGMGTRIEVGVSLSSTEVKVVKSKSNNSSTQGGSDGDSQESQQESSETQSQGEAPTMCSP